MTTVERDTLVLEHLAVIPAQVRMMRHRLTRQVPSADLEQAGRIALLGCAMRFDPSSAASFRTFAEHRVRGAIIDETYSIGILSRRVIRTLRARYGDVGPFELSLSSAVLPSDQFAFEHEPMDSIARRWLVRALRALPSRERRVLIAYYLRETSTVDIAVDMGICESRVTQLKLSGLRRLRLAMGIA